MPKGLTVAVVADDLTGAADTGAQFCAVAGPIRLCPADREASPDPTGDGGGLCLFTNSRHDPPETAARKARKAARRIRRHAPRVVYKKIDSCLRGNIGAEADAMVEALGCRAGFIAPALPGQGRTTENDVHLVGGVPVGESDVARDPLCPVTESRLSRRVAAQSRFRVGHLGLSDVAAGPERLREAVRTLLDQGCRHVVFDAVEDGHLDAVAAAADGFPGGVLLVGSAGLAARQAARLRKAGTPAEPHCGERLHRALWVCGSASALAARQIEVLAGRAGVAPLVLAADRLAAPAGRGDAVERAAAGWTRGVRLLAVSPPGSVGPAADPGAVAEGLARVASEVASRASPDGIFLTGGDTAEAVWRRLGALGIRLDGEILPGVIRGRWIGGAMDGCTVVTKAGAFGHPETLLELFQTLMERQATR
jgi:uncharacterized protein YgbK (DUF1537 family)